MREVSLQPLQWRGDDEVRVAHSKCLESNKEGEWIDDQRSEAPEGSWAALCSAALEDVRKRIPKKGSRSHLESALGHEICKWEGTVNTMSLKYWVLEVDPIEQLPRFNKRVDVLAQIQKSYDKIDLTIALATVKAKRPTGSAAKVAKAQKNKIRVIPIDTEI